MADAAGNNIEEVGVPLGGFLGYAPGDTTPPTPAAGGSLELTLPESFRRAGLIKEDGGFEWTEEPDGDPIRFWQDGYSIPTGNANVKLAFTAAEDSPITRRLRTGKEPDEHGSLTVDGGGNAAKYLFFTEEIFRNGKIRRRAAFGRVESAKVQKSERGTVQGIEFTIDIMRDPAFENNHYREWMITPPDAPVVPED